jgi:amino acid transporter
MESPQKNIPRAIYSSLIIACLIYIVLAISALSALPKEQIIQDKEYALAAGAKTYLGNVGYLIVLFGALLATSSAISGTLFGASRLMAVIADDGYFPSILSKRIKTYIPVNAIIIMCVCSFILIITGSLQVILEFGSITFILVSFLMALSNFKVKKLTHSHNVLTFIAMFGLLIAAIFIFYYEFIENPLQLTYILSLYIIIGFCAYFYSKKHK